MQTPRHLFVLSLLFVAFLLGSVTSVAQTADYCNVPACDTWFCLSFGFDAQFETAYRTTIDAIPFHLLGSNADTVDLDTNGMKDVAEARLLDAILLDRNAANHCCVYNAYMQNYLASAVVAAALVTALQSLQGYIVIDLSIDTVQRLIAGMTTAGQSSTINSLLSSLRTFVPSIPQIDMNLFTDAAAVYLTGPGDADTDGICNKGEYTALVTGSQDFDAYVAAAMDNTSMQNGGGCQNCVEGAVEGSQEGNPEGASEGSVEGVLEGAIEGAAEGMVEGGADGEGGGETEPCVSPIACAVSCDAVGFDAGFEAAWRVIDSLPYVGADPITRDLDGNGIIDVSHAALLDAVLADNSKPNFCCIQAAWVNNKSAATTIADTMYSSLPILESFLPKQAIISLVAGVTTIGEQGTVDALMGLLDQVPGFGDIDLNAFDFSMDGYLAAYGDADLDGICNRGEYNAAVALSESFPLAALNPAQVSNGGGCPSCEGNEGASEGQPEGVLEGEGEGQIPPPPLEIVVQPKSAALYVGMACQFTITTVGGVAPVTFDWKKEGTVLGAPSNHIFTINSIVVSDAGSYSCTVTDGVTTIDSETVTLSVFEPVDLGFHSADTNQDWAINLTELLRVIQFFNLRSLYCMAGTEDGYAPGTGVQDCSPHRADYNPQDWSISLTELLRLIQFFNMPSGAYHILEDSEDGFAPQAG